MARDAWFVKNMPKACKAPGKRLDYVQR